MNLITAFLAWIFDPRPVEHQPGDERYLSEATDIADLERRMRELDRRRPAAPQAFLHA